MNQQVIWDHFQNEGVDAFRHSSPRIEFLADRLRPRERALNIGIGSAELEQRAIGKGVEMYALDPSERAIENVRRTLGMGERAQVGFSQDIPFPDNSFDVVVMTEVLEHLPHDVFAATLVELRRVLIPHGRLIGTVPAREVLDDSIIVCPNCEHQFHRWGHERSFDMKSLAEVLSDDLEVRHVSEHFFISWKSVGMRGKIAGLIRKALSNRGIGTYAIHRNIYFEAVNAR